MENDLPKKFSRPVSIFFISFLNLLERLGYYTIVPLIVLYAMMEDGWNMEKDFASDYYHWFLLLIGTLPLLTGYLSDIYLKQDKGILLGSALTLTGSLLLIRNIFIINIIGLVLIAIGTAFIRPNLWVILGRLYRKTEHNRILGFLIAIFFINLGGFFGPFLSNFIREYNMGWSFVFGVVTVSSILFIVVFLLVRKRFEFIEENLEAKVYETPADDSILDSEMTGMPRSINSFLVISAILIVSTLFWQFDGAIMDFFIAFLGDREEFLLLGFGNADLVFQIMGAGAAFVIGVILFIIWYKKKTGNTLWKIITAIGFLGVASFLASSLTSIPDDNLQEYVVLTAITIAIADMFISPIIICYVTRLSDIRYSSTMVGFSFMFPYLLRRLIYYLQETVDLDWIAIGPIVIFTVFAMLIIFKRPLEKLANGIV